MVYNTRFNPTVNGYLHIGHLYNILVNAGEAHRSSGKFIVRFDDTQRYWAWRFQEQTTPFISSMVDDLYWMGVPVDSYSYQSRMISECDHLMRDNFNYENPQQPFLFDQAAEVVGDLTPYYPFTPTLTAEKVIFDFINSINWVIRGHDLITEDSLYRYFIERFGLGRVRTTYIPRLLFRGDAICKTEGTNKIRDFRMAGCKPSEILGHLADDCLVDVELGWRVDNLRASPALGAWAEEMLR